MATFPLIRGKKKLLLIVMKKLHNLYSLREHRKELRRNPTPQENKIWWYLRRSQLGVKFRRQHSIGGYVVDFFCPEKKLVIEIDGEIHNQNKEYDRVRQLFMEDLGYKTLRFWNKEIDNGVEEVILKIRNNL